MGTHVSGSGYDITPLDQGTIERLAQDLTQEEYRVLLDHGTEPPFCGTLLDNKKDGVYACRLCGLPLFDSAKKFESGTGWPSFYAPFDKEHLKNIEDLSYGMRRIEIRCARCGGHQGHVFPDGPPPTGMRYCLNSASLEFFEKGDEIPQKG
ncbi:MAG: peptide-methionine (R)-S-oxide reductase MsrB [Acidobacteria bacterium]|nr:peptide-methionine (R)-S-oxide reductase MsrB [Acidobacteriota bacterium]MCW5950328.1 peptide-methionine (R)-S-oxide reductase MsrB [Pyrinomonadaceae bacterium]